MTSIIDVIIILLLAFGLVLGFKHGVFRQLVSLVGLFLVLWLSFALKNPISSLFYTYLPFFKFGGLFTGVTVLNILLYEAIAFFIVFSILMVIFRVVVSITALFERLLKLTVILGIPSKILGAIVGLVEMYVVIFIGLFILSQPVFNLTAINNSRLNKQILNNTPVLTKAISKSLDAFKEVYDLRDKYKKESSNNGFNDETLEVLLKYKVVTVKTVEKLIEKDKIKINDVTIIDKYR